MIKQMSVEQAIEILHPDTTRAALAEIEYYGGFNGREACIKAVDAACLVACDAMQKQVAKEPATETKQGMTFYKCPNCGRALFSDKYCGDCGQKIKRE